MSRVQLSFALLTALLCLLGISLVAAIPLLPDPLATHFDALGRPDGWMSRSRHLGLLALAGAGFPAFILGMTHSARYLPAAAMNIPHKEYWLDNSRRQQTVEFLFQYSLWLACLIVGMFIALHWGVVFANRLQPPQFPLPWLLSMIGGFLAGIAVWIVGLYWHFRLPANGSGHLNPPATVCLLLVFLSGIASAAEPDQPPIIAVEGQPLAANLTRVVESLRVLGSPLPSPLSDRLVVAARERNAELLQQLIDPHVLLVVNINPESRVKVERGPAKAELQQSGFTPVLVKVVNDGTVTSRLRILSPQSGAVYAGVARLSMQRQQSLDLTQNENKSNSTDRFLSVAMHDQPPMLNQLSGLNVEYAIALILSTEAGRREATIGFDLGNSEQDLGSRGETAILFQAKPAIPVSLSILDSDGRPTTASLIIQDRQGHVFPQQPKRLAPDFFFQPQIYRAHGETVLLPPGEFTIQSGRGPEYWVRRSSLVVGAHGSTQFRADEHAPDKPLVEIKLERWVDPLKWGFYSGDHHIHAAGCAHYTSPTEGVTPEDMFRQVKGEALNVGCVLTWGPCYRFQRQYFAAAPHNLSEPLTLLKYDLEISGFGSQALGHVCLLNLQDQTYPGSDGTETKGWPMWTTPVLRWAKAQGGVTGYAHSASGLAIEPPQAARRLMTRADANQDGVVSESEGVGLLLPEAFAEIDGNQDGVLNLAELTDSHDRVSDRLPNLAIPEMNGVGAMEICVSTAEGVCDFISAMDTRRIQEWNTWYHILNCGFPLKVSGETDFPCMSSRRVGQGRVYVQLGDEKNAARDSLTYPTWCEGLARGRSYVSDGFAHPLLFRVNDQSSGLDDIQLAGPATVRVVAKVAFAPQTPETVAQGTILPRSGQRLVGDTVELHGPRIDRLIAGGERLVELVVNGQPVASRKVASDGNVHDLEFDVQIPRSSWVALRHFPQFHTNPVNVIVAGQPIRASRASARWCDEVIDLLWKNRHKVIPEPDRAEAQRVFEKAQRTYRQIAMECP